MTQTINAIVASGGLGLNTGVATSEMIDFDSAADAWNFFDSGDAPSLYDLISGNQLGAYAGGGTLAAPVDPATGYLLTVTGKGYSWPHVTPDQQGTLEMLVDYTTGQKTLFSCLNDTTQKGFALGMGAGTSNEFRLDAWMTTDGGATKVKKSININIPFTPTSGEDVFVAFAWDLRGLTDGGGASLNFVRALIGSYGAIELNPNNDAGLAGQLVANGVGTLYIGPGTSTGTGGNKVRMAAHYAAARSLDQLGWKAVGGSDYAVTKGIIRGRTGAKYVPK